MSDNIHKVKSHKHYDSLQDDENLINTNFKIAKPKIEAPESELDDLKELIDRSANSSGILNSIRYSHKCPDHSSVDDIKTELLLIGSDHYIKSAMKIPTTPGLKGPQGTKCFYDNEKFDSLWEVAFWIYHKYIMCNSIKRNHDDFIPYIDHDGKQRKFYYDFFVSGNYYEVKGRYRPSDLAKRDCCPQVTFVDSNDIKLIIKEVNKRFPTWKQDIIKR